jgi:hypothetical protein
VEWRVVRRKHVAAMLADLTDRGYFGGS